MLQGFTLLNLKKIKIKLITYSRKSSQKSGKKWNLTITPRSTF